MGAKQLSYDDEARRKLLAGVSKLARAVRATLGPRGRNAVIDKGWGSPTVTKDGVTVAEEIELEDPYENMGAQLVKEAASKTSDVAGDGTTTATILAEAIYRESLKNIAAGADPMALTRGIQKAVERVVDELHKMAEMLDDKDDREITEVATIASNNNREIGAKLAEALKRVGKDGVITVEEGKTAATEVVVVQGMQFDRGYLSPHFVTNTDSVTVELENPYILIYEEKISAARSLIPLLETIVNKQAPLLIIADEVEGEALATLVINKIKGVVRVCAVKAPGYGDRRNAMLEDIATLTGGRVITKDLGISLETVALTDLGRARRVTLAVETTTIIEGAGSRPAIDGRCEKIRRELRETDSEYDRENLQERLAKLSAGVALIQVGAADATERKTRKDLYEDALHAVRAAISEGIVPGGGVALLHTQGSLDKLHLDGDEGLGIRCLRSVLDIPCRMIAENAGQDGALVVEKVRKSKDRNYGLNVLTGEYTDLRKAGIVDPVKVTRSALQNAASVACLLLTTESMVADRAETSAIPKLASGAIREPGRKPRRRSAPDSAPMVDAPMVDAPAPSVGEYAGEVISVGPEYALCWLDTAGGARVKTRIPLAKLDAVHALAGMKFLWSPSRSMARPLDTPHAAATQTSQVDPADLAEFERLSREFRDDLRHRKLRTE